MFVVANGAWAVEGAKDRPETLIMTREPAGEGWAEAVYALLAMRGLRG